MLGSKEFKKISVVTPPEPYPPSACTLPLVAIHESGMPEQARDPPLEVRSGPVNWICPVDEAAGRTLAWAFRTKGTSKITADKISLESNPTSHLPSTT